VAYPPLTLDINRNRIIPQARVRLRSGVYAGYWATVLEVNGRRVRVRVPAEDPDGRPATLTVSCVTCEVIPTGPSNIL
jgi:transcription antitermination factor NusG